MLVDIHTETERGDVLTTMEELVVGFADKLLIVPPGFESDGASVPRLFWRIVCPPVDPHAVRAGFVHDFIYRNHPKGWTRKDADTMFLGYLILDGMPVSRALLAYWGVRIGGGRAWKQEGKRE